MRRFVAPAVSILLLACGDPAPDPELEGWARDSTTAAAPGDDYPAQVAAGWDIARLPARSALVREGACPFECCQFGEWWTDAPIAVHAAVRGTDTAFVVPPGKGFMAETGVVHVTSLARVVLGDTVRGGDLPSDVTLTPADTLYLVQPLGEGWFVAWVDGREVEVPGFWESWYAERFPVDARLEGEYAHEWWVRVRTSDGRRGWIRMDGITSTVRGVDACA